MAAVQVQTKTAVTTVAASSLAATFDAPPTQNNLLLAIVCSDATVATPSGWSVARAQVDEVGLYLFYKIAGASESSTVTVNPSVAASTELWIAEYSSNVTTGVLDVVSGANSADSTTTASSGTTAATAQADELSVVAFGYNNSPATFPTANSYSGGYVEQAELTGTGGTSTRVAVATVALSATGTQTCTVTFSAAHASHKAGLIATFKMSSGGTTQVSTTRRVVYSVQKNVAATRRVNYAVQAQVAATRRIGYGVLAGVAATRRVAYGVAAAVLATRSIRYDVRAPVVASRRTVYDVAASTSQVSAPRRIGYSVSAQVSTARRVLYDVVRGAAASRSIEYDVLTSARGTRRVAYSVAGNLNAARHIIYTVDGALAPPVVAHVRVHIGTRAPSVPTITVRQ